MYLLFFLWKVSPSLLKRLFYVFLAQFGVVLLKFGFLLVEKYLVGRLGLFRLVAFFLLFRNGIFYKLCNKKRYLKIIQIFRASRSKI
jgi:hypothetical protein